VVLGLAAVAAPLPVEVGPAVGAVRATGDLAGPTPSSVLVEGYDLDAVEGAEGDALSVFVAFDGFECVHDATLAADVEVDRRISRATVRGTAAGTCSDRGEVQAGVTSVVDLHWEGTGRASRTTTTTTQDGRTCRTTIREREGVVSGTVRWTAPDLEAEGAGALAGPATVRVERTVCRPA